VNLTKQFPVAVDGRLELGLTLGCQQHLHQPQLGNNSQHTGGKYGTTLPFDTV